MIRGEVVDSGQLSQPTTPWPLLTVTVSVDILAPYAFAALMDLLAKANDIATVVIPEKG